MVSEAEPRGHHHPKDPSPADTCEGRYPESGLAADALPHRGEHGHLPLILSLSKHAGDSEARYTAAPTGLRPHALHEAKNKAARPGKSQDLIKEMHNATPLPPKESTSIPEIPAKAGIQSAASERTRCLIGPTMDTCLRRRLRDERQAALSPIHREAGIKTKEHASCEARSVDTEAQP